jgi:protein phosphatase
MKLQCSAQTDVGLVRDHNEDSYGVGEGPQIEQHGHLLVVCDGMGGHAAGEVASRIGVDTILAEYYADQDQDRSMALRRAVERANAEVYRQGRGTMGSTAVVALLYHNTLYVANVGDSRAYLIRGGSIHQISRDHSLVNDQIDAGLLTPEEARVSNIRNIITRALGHQGGVAVDVFRTGLLRDDVVLLSSDGLHGLVTDAELAGLISQQPLDQTPAVLIALANQRGGHDNITAVLARVVQLDPDAGPGQTSAEADTDPALPALSNTLHSQSTDRLPETAPAAPVAAPAIVSELAAAPASQAPERRLTIVGGLLATVLLAVLAVVIVYAINLPAPSGGTPAHLPDSIRPIGPALADTAVPSPAPTSAPGPAATAPSLPTAAPGLPTSAPTLSSPAPTP